MSASNRLASQHASRSERTVEQRRLDDEAAGDEQAEAGAAEESALGRDTSARTAATSREAGRPFLNLASHLGERIATWRRERPPPCFQRERGSRAEGSAK